MLDGIMTGWNYDITTKKRDNFRDKTHQNGDRVEQMNGV